MTLSNFLPQDHQKLAIVKVPLSGAVATAGGVGAKLNPFGTRVIVNRVVIEVATQSTLAATVDAGIAANGTTLADGLVDGLSVAAAGFFDNLADPGTNGQPAAAWGASEYFTVSQASGDVADLVGNAYLYCNLD